MHKRAVKNKARKKANGSKEGRKERKQGKGRGAKGRQGKQKKQKKKKRKERKGNENSYFEMKAVGAFNGQRLNEGKRKGRHNKGETAQHVTKGREGDG